MIETRYLRSQLCRLARVPDDVMSFWLKQGILDDGRQSEGRGYKRRFSRDEVKLAAFLREARNAGMNIDAMRSLTSIYRRAAALFAPILDFRFRLEVVGEISDGELHWKWEDWLERGQMTQDEYDRVPVIRNQMAGVSKEDLYLVVNFVDEEGLWVASRDKAGHWQLNTRMAEDRLETPFAIAFDLKKIFEIDWGAA